MAENCDSMANAMPHHPLEQQLSEEIQIRLIRLKMTKSALGALVAPDSKRPDAVVGPYLSGSRGLMTDVTLRMLQELGAKKITVEWEEIR